MKAFFSGLCCWKGLTSLLYSGCDAADLSTLLPRNPQKIKRKKKCVKKGAASVILDFLGVLVHEVLTTDQNRDLPTAQETHKLIKNIT